MLAGDGVIAETDIGTLRILLVEDEALVAMLIEDALGLHGHVVVGVADTTEAALRIADAERPDLALCDIRLAEGDTGVVVARGLADRGIPSLFLCGGCPPRSDNPLIIGCVAKPFHSGQIRVAVRIARAIADGRAITCVPPGLTLYVGGGAPSA